ERERATGDRRDAASAEIEDGAGAGTARERDERGRRELPTGERDERGIAGADGGEGRVGGVEDRAGEDGIRRTGGETEQRATDGEGAAGSGDLDDVLRAEHGAAAAGVHLYQHGAT